MFMCLEMFKSIKALHWGAHIERENIVWKQGFDCSNIMKRASEFTRQIIVIKIILFIVLYIALLFYCITLCLRVNLTRTEFTFYLKTINVFATTNTEIKMKTKAIDINISKIKMRHQSWLFLQSF